MDYFDSHDSPANEMKPLFRWLQGSYRYVVFVSVVNPEWTSPLGNIVSTSAWGLAPALVCMPCPSTPLPNATCGLKASAACRSVEEKVRCVRIELLPPLLLLLANTFFVLYTIFA